MTYAYTATERKRVSFGKIPEAMELPNLISVQRESFERFKDEGLREAFKESSPRTMFSRLPSASISSATPRTPSRSAARRI